jgi:porphobilinogen synthase
MVLSPSPSPPVADELIALAGSESSQVLPLTHRPRRLRRTEGLRRMVRETRLTVDDLIYPMFVMEGIDQRQEVPSMPGCFRYSLDLLLDELQEVSGARYWVRSPSSP